MWKVMELCLVPNTALQRQACRYVVHNEERGAVSHGSS